MLWINVLFCLAMAPGQDVVGAWEMVPVDQHHDHDHEGHDHEGHDHGEPKSEELLYLYKDGRFMIDGLTVMRSRYEMDGDHLVMVMSISGKDVKQPRKFKVEGDKLSLGEGNDAVVYKKSKKPMPQWKANSWVEMSTGKFKLKTPALWHFRKEPNPEAPAQRMFVQRPDGLQALSLTYLPDRKGQSVDLPSALKNMMSPALLSLQISPNMVSHTQGTFYKREGHLLEAFQTVDHKKVVVKIFGQKLPSGDYLVAQMNYEDGDEADLTKIMESLTIQK